MKVFCFALLFLLCSSLKGLQINYYSSLGQIFDQVNLENGIFQTYFDANDYNDIIKGSIDFPGATFVEQDVYSSKEYLRNAQVHIQARADCSFSKAKLVNPYSLLVEEGSRFLYVDQKNIQFEKEPHLNDKVLLTRFKDTKAKKSNFTYLTNGLSWTPRYDVTVMNESSATLRALADIVNNHQRAYHVNNSTLTTGTVYLVGSSPSPIIFASANMMAAGPISATPTASNYGTYTYSINEAYTLYPKSTKTFPFITPAIAFVYTLEATTYIQSGGLSNGLFQRTFNIKSSEFLPAGPITFYQNQMVLGQASISDTAKNTNITGTLGADPDIQYKIASVVTGVHQSPSGQDLSVNVTLVNRKEKQTVVAKLTLYGVYQSTMLSTKSTSPGLTIKQDPLNNSTLIIRATIQPGKEESASFSLKQSN
jgi:hypothetical protein